MLVKESISFERGGDPKQVLGIGDYHVKAEKTFPGKKIAYYLSDTNEFEYKNKKRKYDVTLTIASFLRTKDILIYVYQEKNYGYINASTMASMIYDYGAVYVREDLYTEF